jgi:hypothetical protein
MTRVGFYTGLGLCDVRKWHCNTAILAQNSIVGGLASLPRHKSLLAKTHLLVVRKPLGLSQPCANKNDLLVIFHIHKLGCQNHQGWNILGGALVGKPRHHPWPHRHPCCRPAAVDRPEGPLALSYANLGQDVWAPQHPRQAGSDRGKISH